MICCCFSYTKLNLNVIALICSIIISCGTNNFIYSKNKINFDTQINSSYINTKEDVFKEENLYSFETEEKGTWCLEIPKINLKANISEGTSQEILNQYIGHFEETSKENGNIALAAHNRGYNVNYFSRLKELNRGDEVFYFYNGKKEKYIVETVKIIKDIELDVLENTKENILTMITCVEDEPLLRRCIQAQKIDN